MADIIELLPDAISSQIAAGEVIQRPASAVKELLENAIDAGSTKIKLVIKNAGKGLIQIIDDGCGMSETDARLCFEKHATSKIRSIDDLFSIKTMGFRGEALASIAAVSRVELKTRVHGEQLGTLLQIDASEVKKQEPCQTSEGTSIAVYNLFYNIPARRNFLKSSSVELRHIIEEFQRIAIAYPHLSFSLYNEEKLLFQLNKGNLRKRLVEIFGDKYNERLVPIEEDTDIIRISGFAGKPEFAKKTRGEQYIFVNQRFIKSPYLNHAIFKAYDDILPKDTYPLFALFIDIDPDRIDINVHPTKQEIKFEDERLVYTFVNAGVRHSLAQYSITPSLDFEQEQGFGSLAGFRSPMPNSGSIGGRESSGFKQGPSITGWEQLFQTGDPDTMTITVPSESTSGILIDESQDQAIYKAFQLHNRYIISPIKSGFIVIDQQAAHERILFEKYLNMLHQQNSSCQQILFPKHIDLPVKDAELLMNILTDINKLGFDIRHFGDRTFVVNGFPADIDAGDEIQMIEELLEQYKQINALQQYSKRESLAASLACSAAIRGKKQLSPEEMKLLADQLFSCQNPYTSPRGGFNFIKIDFEELQKRFENK